MSSALAYEIRLDFLNWADEKYGSVERAVNVNIPDEFVDLAYIYNFTTKIESLNGDIFHSVLHVILDNGSLGALAINSQGQHTARESNTFISEFEILRNELKNSVDPEKAISRLSKLDCGRLLDVFNRYGVTVTRQDVAPITYLNLFNKDLLYWRSYALGFVRQNRHPNAFKVLKARSKMYRHDSRKFEEYLREKISEEDPKIIDLIKSGVEGYTAIANMFFRGNLRTAFDRVSRICKECENDSIKKWQIFFGNVTDFRMIREALTTENYDGIEGFIEFADEFYLGDMNRAYVNCSAVSAMANVKMPSKWQVFFGDTTYAAEIISHVRHMKSEELLDFYSGITDVVARRNYRGVANMLDLSFPKLGKSPASL